MKCFFYLIFLFFGSCVYSNSEACELSKNEYVLDAQGRVSSWHKKNGITIFYEYDSSDRMISLKSSDLTLHYEYKYGDLLEPIEIIDKIAHSKIQRFYENKMLIKETSPTFSIQKKYDEKNQVKEIIYPDNSSAKYQYQDSNLTEVLRYDPSNILLYSHKYEYSNNALKETLINGNGLVTSFFDENLMLVERKAPYISFKLTDSPTKKNISSSYYETSYNFDEKNQLIKETGMFNNSFSYDEKFNKISKNDKTFTINEKNQLLSDTDSEYKYDLNGNLTEEISSDDSYIYSYDALDRLKAVLCINKYKILFFYDGLNRRICKETYSFENENFQLISKRFFFYDNNHEIGSLDEKGQIVELKVMGKNQILSYKEPIAIEIDKKPYAPIYDLNHNLCALLFDGKLVETYHYSAFGQTRFFDENFDELETSKTKNPWRFCSKRVDEETKLVFFDRRYYSPRAERWITPDPNGSIDSSNLYAFVLNNPINNVDLHGFSSISIEMQKVFYYLTRQTAKVAASFGSLMEYLNDEMIAFPFLNKVFSLSSGFIKFAFNPFELDPYIKLLKPLGKENPKIRMGYLNGICNVCPQECIDSGETIVSKIDERAELDLYYLASHGCVIDYLECIFLKLNMQTPNTERFKNLLSENLKKVPSDGKYILFLHSKSALIAKIAISELSDEEKSKIEIYASAPIELLPKELCSSVKNVLSKSDGISLLNSIQIVQTLCSNSIDLEWIDSIDSPFPSDHFFLSKSYQLRLKKQMDEIIERFILPQETKLAKNNRS